MGYTQPTRRAHPKYLAWGYGRLCHWSLQDTYYIRPRYQDRKSQQIHLIYRNKHKKTAKMRRKRNMAQMKEQNKTPEKELDKREISHLSHAEFKTLVIRMFKELSGYFNSIKKKPRQKLRIYQLK